MKVFFIGLLVACGASSDPTTEPPLTLPAATHRADLEASPTITVTATEVLVGATSVGKTRDLAGSHGLIARLLEELAAVRHPTGKLLLHTEPTTDATVIERVVETAKHAGFPDVVFAVKKR